MIGHVGNMPPIVTNPTVIQVQVNFTFRVQFTAQDPNNDSVSFSLLFPRPPLASIGSGEQACRHSSVQSQACPDTLAH